MGKCAVKHRVGEKVDAGAFSPRLVSKTAEGLVFKGFASEGSAIVPLVFERGMENPKKDRCPRSAGGAAPDCRIQLTSSPDGDGLAVRLCKEVETPGYTVKVRSPEEARRVAEQFCKCKKAGHAEACAMKLGGQHEDQGRVVLSGLDEPEEIS
jgi:hypothetical protein